MPGAEILDTASDTRGTRLVIGSPGAWFQGFAGRRLVLGQGGEWTIHRPLSAAPSRPLHRADR